MQCARWWCRLLTLLSTSLYLVTLGHPFYVLRVVVVIARCPQHLKGQVTDDRRCSARFIHKVCYESRPFSVSLSLFLSLSLTLSAYLCSSERWILGTGYSYCLKSHSLGAEKLSSGYPPPPPPHMNIHIQINLYLWSRKRNFHSRECLEVNSHVSSSMLDISRMMCEVWSRTVQQKHRDMLGDCMPIGSLERSSIITSANTNHTWHKSCGLLL